MINPFALLAYPILPARPLHPLLSCRSSASPTSPTFARPLLSSPTSPTFQYLVLPSPPSFPFIFRRSLDLPLSGTILSITVRGTISPSLPLIGADILPRASRARHASYKEAGQDKGFETSFCSGYRFISSFDIISRRETSALFPVSSLEETIARFLLGSIGGVGNSDGPEHHDITMS
jgi:hypothetical protein